MRPRVLSSYRRLGAILISMIPSTSTGMLPGRDPIPTADRAPTPLSSPKISISTSEQPFAYKRQCVTFIKLDQLQCICTTVICSSKS